MTKFAFYFIIILSMRERIILAVAESMLAIDDRHYSFAADTLISSRLV